VPDATPVTTPAPVPMVAIVVVPLAQVPPVVPSVNVTVEPAHTGALPPIAPGEAFTVTTLVE